ncbi:fam-g protein [Plasmodium gallinaceum]|uniref:Fam-g protein n=1 Tax=Plasmodium gallinaceum TaxID=5849 RepID=A0A1J1GNL9_PLAGA|nr:fam-g protein [Plasmodium gallinaceum]CRG94073.1 fam-g protein [Plasmodium gallinaceum]
MKTFTLYSKIFTFLFIIWIFHCFYNYDYSRSLIDKDALQMKNWLKNERTLAEVGILEKEQNNLRDIYASSNETCKKINKCGDQILDVKSNNNSQNCESYPP